MTLLYVLEYNMLYLYLLKMAAIPELTTEKPRGISHCLG